MREMRHVREDDAGHQGLCKLDVILNDFLKWHTLWLRRLEDAFLVHHLGKLCGKVLPGHPLGFDIVPTAVDTALSRPRCCNLENLEHERQYVQDMSLTSVSNTSGGSTDGLTVLNTALPSPMYKT